MKKKSTKSHSQLIVKNFILQVLVDNLCSLFLMFKRDDGKNLDVAEGDGYRCRRGTFWGHVERKHLLPQL